MSDRNVDAFANYQDYGLDFRNRRVFLQHAIEPAQDVHEIGTEHVVRNLLWLDSLGSGKEPIELWINTVGGYFEEMWAIYDVMQQAKHPIITVALGNVSSAGCLLLAGGTGQRYAARYSSFMWHGGTTGIYSHLPHAESQDRSEWEKFEHERWCAVMAEHTKPPRTRSKKQRADFWSKWTVGREKWLDAKGMIEHGVVDEIWAK